MGYDYTKIINEILNFLNSKEKTLYVTDEVIKIYLRKSTRYYQKRAIVNCLDIANISIPEVIWNNGIGTRFFEVLFDKFSEYNIYIENVLNPALIHILEKFNLEKHYVCDEDVCYIIIKNEKLKL